MSTKRTKFAATVVKSKCVVRFWDLRGNTTDYEAQDDTVWSLGFINSNKNKIARGSLAITLDVQDGKAANLIIYEYRDVGWQDLESINLSELVTLKKLAGD